MQITPTNGYSRGGDIVELLLMDQHLSLMNSTGTQIITTGEWLLPLSANFTIVDVTAAVGESVWVCGGASSTTCVVVDAKSDITDTVAIGATSTRSGVAYSEIAVCDSSASLLCSVLEFSDTTFVAAVNVPYTRQIVFVGHHTGNPSVSVMEPSTEAGVGTVRHYAYTPSALKFKLKFKLNFHFTRNVTILKVSAATGAVLQQMRLSIDNGNVSCAEITASPLSLSVTCAVQDSLDSTVSRVVLATNRDLSFKRLPAGWTRNSTISFTRQLTPFSATSFTAPTTSKVIPTSSFTYSTLGQTPTWRPTAAPTIALSSRPTDPTLRPTRSPTVRPSRAFTTVAPSAADSNGTVDDSVLPTSESGGKQGGLTTEAIVIAVSAAGGAIGFGCLALLICAACSYKLRKNRKKYVERRKTLHPSNDIPAMTLEARRIETLKVLKENLKSASKTKAQIPTQCTITSDSVTAVHAVLPPDESDVQSADANSLSDSSLEMSSLHSSEISDTEYYFTGVVNGSKTTKSVRRLSEMEAQRVLSSEESQTESKGVDVDDDSSIERGFNEIMAEFSDDSSWDGSHL
eukprot:gene7521-9018_t